MVHYAILALAAGTYLGLISRRTPVDFLAPRVWLIAGAAFAGAAAPLVLVGGEAGLSVSGALTGLTAFALAVPSPLATHALLAFPAGSALARLACWYRGCCFGQPHTSWASMTWSPTTPAFASQVEAGLLAPGSAQSLPVFPSQPVLVAAGAFLALVAALGRRRNIPGLEGWVAAGLAAVSLAVQTQRIEPTWWGSWTAGMVLDATTVLLGLGLAKRQRRRRGA